MWPFKKKNKLPIQVVDNAVKEPILEEVIKSAEPIDKSKYKNCSIEKMPKSNKHYPRYNGEYIWWYDGSGWRLSKDISLCKYFYNIEDCIDFFDTFLEEQGITSEIIEIL